MGELSLRRMGGKGAAITDPQNISVITLSATNPYLLGFELDGFTSVPDNFIFVGSHLNATIATSLSSTSGTNYGAFIIIKNGSTCGFIYTQRSTSGDYVNSNAFSCSVVNGKLRLTPKGTYPNFGPCTYSVSYTVDTSKTYGSKIIK